MCFLGIRWTWALLQNTLCKKNVESFLLRFNFTGTRLRTVWSRHFWFLFRFNLFIRLSLIIVIRNYNIRVDIRLDRLGIICNYSAFRGGRCDNGRLGDWRYLGSGRRGLPKRRIVIGLDMTDNSGGKVQKPLLVATGAEEPLGPQNWFCGNKSAYVLI